MDRARPRRAYPALGAVVGVALVATIALISRGYSVEEGVWDRRVMIEETDAVARA
jgi:hypothetical protein